MTTRTAERRAIHGTGKQYWRRLGNEVRRDKWLYFLLLPGLIYFIVFKYLPMFGIVIAFENYVPFSGVLGSQWVGFKWFNSFFRFPAWLTYLKNTLILSLMNIVFFFPAPIILALLLNEMRRQRYKKLLQTFLYVPHFISIVIVVSITFVMFGPSGIVYKATQNLLGHPINYMGSPDTFRWMIIGQTIWKETGWGTIIFLAA
ncbi:MAG: sugar ABC transporter permease, partial [Clostridia bacterium]|nr:sugar ABC transporter permease [Clostridia bacterium]